MDKEFNAVAFFRKDVDFHPDNIIPLAIPEITSIYKEQAEAGMLVTGLSICEDGTLLLYSQKEEL